jgi:chromosome segregation ATPase
MIITKILGGISLLGLITSLLLFSLYQSTDSELSLLESQHTELQKNYKECSESKKNLIESKAVSEQVVSDQQTKLIKLEEDKDSLVGQLNSIPRKDCAKPKSIPSKGKESEVKDEINYVDIDSPYDDEYLSVFRKLSKGDPNTTR